MAAMTKTRKAVGTGANKQLQVKSEGSLDNCVSFRAQCFAHELLAWVCFGNAMHRGSVRCFNFLSAIGIFNMQICIMKEVVWLMNEHPKHLPLMSAYLPSLTKHLTFITFYIVLWSLSYFIHKAIKYSELIDSRSMATGFLVGLILLLGHRALTKGLYQVSIAGTGSEAGNYFLLKSNSDYKIVTENTRFRIPKTKIVMMKKDAYLAHKRNGDITDTDVDEYYKEASKSQLKRGKLWKQLQSSTFVDRASESRLDSTAYHFVMVMLSLAVITAKMDTVLFYALLPWFIMSTIFSIGTQSVFLFNPLVTDVVEEYLTKQTLLIIGLSFGVMVISVILQR